LQTCPDWELLLIDDGSSDGTAEVVTDLLADRRIRLLRHSESRGLACRLNQAVALSRGEFIARMDADDIAFPDRLERQREHLRANPEMSLVGSSMVVFDSDGSLKFCLVPPRSHGELLYRAWTQVPLPHPTWMGRSSWFSINPYPEQARRGQDQCLLFMARHTSCYSCLSEPLVGYRGGAAPLGKSVEGRWHFVRTVWKHGTMTEFAGALGYHAATLVVRAVFGGVLVRHARTHYVGVSPALRARWRDIWNSAHADTTMVDATD